MKDLTADEVGMVSGGEGVSFPPDRSNNGPSSQFVAVARRPTVVRSSSMKVDISFSASGNPRSAGMMVRVSGTF